MSVGLSAEDPVPCPPVGVVVQKFGGTSVADPDRIREVADHVARCRRRGDQIVVVVSAMGKETDQLLHLAHQVSRTRPGREMDMLITAGDRKSTALVCMALHDRGVPADSFTGSQAGFITDTSHMNAKILEVRAERIREAVEAGRVPVVAGAQGVSTDRDVTFLGRGGSDTTAVAIAEALGGVCELYTDVPCVFTTDPRVVQAARRIGRISFDEMLEMCAAGCPKPAMRAVEFARTHRVPLHVRSAFTWEPGTWITEEESDMEDAIVSGVVGDDSEAKITISEVPDQPGVAAKVFRGLAAAGINVDMIVQNVSEAGHTDISFTLPADDLITAVDLAQAISSDIGADRVIPDGSVAKISLVGAGMKTNPGVAATVFETLAANDINIEMISTSAIRISVVVAVDECDRAFTALHSAFGLDTPGN
ncbi:aspartate kinase [soil metagenome]